MASSSSAAALLPRLHCCITLESSSHGFFHSRRFSCGFLSSLLDGRSWAGAVFGNGGNPSVVLEGFKHRGLCSRSSVGAEVRESNGAAEQQGELDSGRATRSDVRASERSGKRSRDSSGKSGRIAMANVTRKNFAESVEQLEGQLQMANFVAVDLEMTGVESTMWRRNLELDSYETRYQNLKHSAEKFAVWQFGVCPFKWDKANKKFIAYPYNFFIFPRNELQLDKPLRGFFAQTTSLEFLAKHRFDFNACVYDGISYLSHDQEAAARMQLGLGSGKNQSKQNESEVHEIPLSTSGDVVFVEKIRVRIGEWQDELHFNRQKWQFPENLGTIIKYNPPSWFPIQTAAAQDPVTKVNIAGATAFGSLRPSLSIDVMSAHQTRLVKQVLRKHYPDLVGIVKEKNSPLERTQISVVYASSKEDKTQLLQELADEEQRALEKRVSDAVGFRKVIDLIVEVGLPVVGHNCILDMTHIHSKFMSPLPANIGKFSSSLLRQFPCIIDTKYLLRAEPTLRGILANRSTSLAIVYTHICQAFADKAVVTGRFNFGKGKILNNSFSKVVVEVAQDFQKYGGAKDTGLKHEAGFDAYMTGAVFAQACHLLQVDASAISTLPDAVKAGEHGLAGYANLLALGWVGNMALDLTTGTEATGAKALQPPHLPANGRFQYSKVALIWGFPVGCKELEIRTIVQELFKPEHRTPSVDITIVDESSAFAHFKDPSVMLKFLHLLRKERIAQSEELPSLQRKRNVPSLQAAPYEAYEHLCKSSLTTERLADSANLLQLENFSPRESALDLNFDQSHLRKVKGGADPARVMEDTKQETAVLHFPEPSDWGVGTSSPVQEPDKTGVSEGNLEFELGVETAEDQITIAHIAPTDLDQNREDLSPAAAGLKYSSWMKRSFKGEQSLSELSSIKRSRSQGPGDSSNS